MSPETRPSVFVHFDHGRGPVEGADWDADPEAFPYGYGHCSPYIRLSVSKNKRESRAVRLVRRGAAHVLGFDLLHAFRNREAIRNADAVITHTEHEHLAIAVLKRMRIVPGVPVVGQSIWIWDHWTSMDPLRRLVYRSLLREIDVHTTHSEKNAAFGSEQIGVRVHVVPYGAHVPQVADGFTSHPPSESDAIRVVAPGSDRHRDWRTLIAATRRAPDLRVTIISRRLRPRLLALFRAPGVEVRRAHSFHEVQGAMRGASVVAVPLKPNMHASGLTVLFEGLLARRAVVATRTGGLDLYGADHVLWASVGDPDSLVAAIQQAHAGRDDMDARQRAWESVAERGLTLQDYGLRHVLAVWMAMREPVDPSLVSVRRPIAPVVAAEARTRSGRRGTGPNCR